MNCRPPAYGAALLLGLASASCVASGERDFVAAVSPQSTVVPVPWVEVPMDLGVGVPVVDVRIGDREPVRMILDTGFVYTIVSPQLAASLRLEPAGTVLQSGVERQLLRVPRLDLGEASFRDVQVVVTDVPAIFGGNAQGILGLTTFAQSVLELDGPARRVRIGRDPLRATADGRGVFTYTGQQFRPEVSMLVEDRAGNSARFRLLIDSGCNGGIELPDACTTLPFAADQLGEVMSQTMWGTARRRVLRLHATARVGDLAIGQPRVTVYTAGKQWQDAELGLLGMAVLSAIVVRLDPQQRLVQFLDPAAPRGPPR